VIWKIATGTKQLPNGGDIQKSGLVLALATVFSSPIAVGLAILFAWLRKGIRIGDYLAWKWPGAKIAIQWCFAFMAFMAAGDSISIMIGRPLVPDVMVDLYQRAEFVWLLWLALIIFGPVAEEFIFRGFLFSGMRSSKLGGLGTVILTSAAWSVLHLQYDAYGMFCVFLSGLFLGYARLRTGSLLLCILMHSLMNLIATIETIFMLP